MATDLCYQLKINNDENRKLSLKINNDENRKLTFKHNPKHGQTIYYM